MGRVSVAPPRRAHRARRRACIALVVGVLAAGCVAGQTGADRRADTDQESADDTATPTPVEPSPTPGATPSPSSASPSPTPTAWPAGRLPDDFELALNEVADGFEQPTFVTAPPGDPRLFVVEKVGRIRIVADGDVQPEPFLDVRDKVRAGGPTAEQGMFALAFHPDYASNGRFFIHYTARPHGNTRVDEYRVSTSDPDRADERTRRTVLRVDQPFRWHNGGMMTFGPDGMLWLALGDGGVKNDPDDHGQNPRTLLGSILRLDVDGRADGKEYGIPPDNPFADGTEGAPEVWAYGLRNPWRFDIDPRRKVVYIADVGEYEFEEINVVGLDEPGRNFGWAVREGDECFADRSSDCPSKGFVDPVVHYSHQDTCAVVGGVVYRGTALPELAGRYFYTDFCGGGLRSFRYNAKRKAVEKRDWTEQVGRIPLPTSFGLDADGEVYITSAEGAIYRLVPGDG